MSGCGLLAIRQRSPCEATASVKPQEVSGVKRTASSKERRSQQPRSDSRDAALCEAFRGMFMREKGKAVTGPHASTRAGAPTCSGYFSKRDLSPTGEGGKDSPLSDLGT